MNIYQSHTYRIQLSWQHFDDEPAKGSREREREREKVKEQQSYISAFAIYITIPSSSWGTGPEITTVIHAWPYGRLLEIQSNLSRKKLHRRHQGSNYLGGNFSNRDNIRTPTQFRGQVNPSNLKDDFSTRTDPSIFSSTAPVLSDRSNKTSWFFPALKSTSNFLPHSKVSRRSDSCLEANSSCCHRSDAWSQLE